VSSTATFDTIVISNSRGLLEAERALIFSSRTIIGISVGVFMFVLLVALVPVFVMCGAAATVNKRKRENRVGECQFQMAGFSLYRVLKSLAIEIADKN
jgi:hypothetical protein